jgi:hypothetical protein
MSEIRTNSSNPEPDEGLFYDRPVTPSGRVLNTAINDSWHENNARGGITAD